MFNFNFFGNNFLNIEKFESAVGVILHQGYLQGLLENEFTR